MTRLGKRHARIPLAGLATAVAAGLGVAAALGAAPGPAAAVAATWTIKPGGSFSASSGIATFHDAKTGSNFKCMSVAVSGTLKSGSGLSGSGAGSISAVSFTNCTSPINLRLFLQATGLPWHVNLAAAANGAVTGTIGHIQVTEQGPGCSFVLDGTGATAHDGRLKFRYTNGTGKLTVLRTGGNLTVYGVVGCAGIWNTGDPETISATFTLTPRQTITSP